MKMRLRDSRPEDGASLLEFSLVAFMLVILLLGVVEIGRMVLVYTALDHAARAGVRYAIVHGSDNTSTSVSASCAPTSCTNLNTVVQNYAGTGLINSSRVTTSVTLPDSTNDPGKRVQVSVTYTYDPLVSYFSSRLSVTMGSTSQGVFVF